MSEQRVIALLGRKDRPTDAVEEYCRYLGRALVDHAYKLEIRRVPWDQHGWKRSLEALKLQAESWRGAWVFVQYTALAWSARGFPTRFLKVLRELRRSGARIGVVFHDVTPFGGTRLIDRLRRGCQLRVMRATLAAADKVISTVALERVPWLGAAKNAVFIPVGANLPFPISPQDHKELHTPPVVGVFGITGGSAGEREARQIVEVLRSVSEAVGSLRLHAFGRHAELQEAALRDGLRGVPVEIQVEGVIDDRELCARFAGMDLLLFVRGQISSRRGSAIAGIACAVPLIAIEGHETAPPITEAGVLLIADKGNDDDRQRAFAEAVVRLVKDRALRVDLVRRNQLVQERYLCWPAIAKKYTEILHNVN